MLTCVELITHSSTRKPKALRKPSRLVLLVAFAQVSECFLCESLQLFQDCRRDPCRHYFQLDLPLCSAIVYAQLSARVLSWSPQPRSSVSPRTYLLQPFCSMSKRVRDDTEDIIQAALKEDETSKKLQKREKLRHGVSPDCENNSLNVGKLLTETRT